MTPHVKALLRMSKLLRHGKVDSALPVSRKIGKLIADARSKLLSEATASDTKQLWQLLRNTGNWSNRLKVTPLTVLDLLQMIWMHILLILPQTHITLKMNSTINCAHLMMGNLSSSVHLVLNCLYQSWAELGPDPQGLTKYLSGYIKHVLLSLDKW